MDNTMVIKDLDKPLRLKTTATKPYVESYHACRANYPRQIPAKHGACYKEIPHEIPGGIIPAGSTLVLGQETADIVERPNIQQLHTAVVEDSSTFPVVVLNREDTVLHLPNIIGHVRVMVASNKSNFYQGPRVFEITNSNYLLTNNKHVKEH